MKPLVGLIDYGMGNLHSVSKAIESQGARVRVTDNVSSLKKSDLIVLPGVGSFGAAAKTLRKKKLDRFVKDWVAEDRPYLGICLGYQLLFEKSEEDPGVPGLGILPGKVVRFRFNKTQAKKMDVPHMGWNLTKKKSSSRIFTGITSKDYFYFVHTFYPVPKKESDVFTTTTYGKPFCSSVKRGNLFASQFHPEKSGRVGMKVLKNILTEVKKAC